MRYEIKNKVLTFYLDDPKRADESTRTVSFIGTVLTEANLIPMMDALVRKFGGYSMSSQSRVHGHLVRPLLTMIKTSGCHWPQRSVEWQLLVAQFFQYFLTDNRWSQAKTSIRIRMWKSTINPSLEFLKDEEIIPLDVVIPRLTEKKVKSLASSQPILGQANPRILTSSDVARKLLVDIDFGMTDADYLDSVEMKCRRLVGIIKDVCIMHWNGLMSDAETGRKLAAQVTNTDIDEAVVTGQYKSPTKYGVYPYASPIHSQGVNWALAIVRRTLNVAKDIECISIDALSSSPFFNKVTFTSPARSYGALSICTAMPQDAWLQLTPQAQFYRFAGMLTNLDVAAVRCLLTIEHPHFNAESLQNAVLLNSRGKPRLLITDNDGRSIFYCDKPRAGRLKYATLTELSQRLILDIIRCTSAARDVLRRAKDKTWRYLFLGVSKLERHVGNLGVVEGKTQFLHGGSRSLGLANLYPTLLQNGLSPGSFDYRRLRNTMGIIRWFETGSILELSRRLGNTRKVALEHYLPPALLHAWNTRIIRRFQNTLIVLAAYDEPYLLDVTDFSNMADLQHFVAQVIAEHPTKSSPIADEVEKRLGSRKPGEAILSASTRGFLNIHLSPQSLGLLYSFSDLALTTLSPDQLDKVDALSGLAPRQFTDIASLLRHAAENQEIHPSLRESLDVQLLTQVHGHALALKMGFDAQFAKLAVKDQWTDNNG